MCRDFYNDKMLRITVLCLLATSTFARLVPQQISIDLNGRIVGGTDADLGEYPSQLSIQEPDSHSCGASVLNENWALTAAHCVEGIDPSGLTVVAGTLKWEEGGTRHQVIRTIVHEDYSPPDFYVNDIALVEVVEPFEFSDLVQPVSLPTQDQETAAGANATVIGWGRISIGGPHADVLQELTVLVTDQDSCVSIYESLEATVFSTQICAGIPEGGASPCSGDSGGPLFVDGTVVGLTSWSAGACGAPGIPLIYTRVASYRDWISANTGV